MIDPGLIEYDDLSPFYKDIADIIGVDGAVKIGLKFGGYERYFPSLNKAKIKVRNRQLIDEYINSKKTVKAIAKKYSITERQVLNIVSEGSSVAD